VIDWPALLATIVVALFSSAVLTSILNNLFLSLREERDRRREARGMLQRARSAANMLLEGTNVAAYDSAARVRRTFVSVKNLMLSQEFTTATADLDIDDAYRALEKLQTTTTQLDTISQELGSAAADPRAWMMVGDEPNPDIDEQAYNRLESAQKVRDNLAKAVTRDVERLLASIKSQQQELRSRRVTLANLFGFD